MGGCLARKLSGSNSRVYLGALMPNQWRGFCRMFEGDLPSEDEWLITAGGR